MVILKRDSARYAERGRGKVKKKQELEILEKLLEIKKEALIKAAKYLSKVRGKANAKFTD
jgi:hypothetical protein